MNAPVLSPDYWGGYLIYRLYSSNGVVIDDRHDFYGEEFLRLYLEMVHVEPGWNEFLKLHAVSVACCCREARRSRLSLAETPGWKQIYSDDVAIVFMQDRA